MGMSAVSPPTAPAASELHSASARKVPVSETEISLKEEKQAQAGSSQPPSSPAKPLGGGLR